MTNDEWRMANEELRAFRMTTATKTKAHLTNRRTSNLVLLSFGFRVHGVFDSDTSTGSVTVNVEPRPASLATVMSPPMSRQNFWLMARPRPVPPYFLVVETSACSKAWKSLASCAGVMPMPVSRTRNERCEV